MPDVGSVGGDSSSQITKTEHSAEKLTTAPIQPSALEDTSSEGGENNSIKKGNADLTPHSYADIPQQTTSLAPYRTMARPPGPTAGGLVFEVPVDLAVRASVNSAPPNFEVPADFKTLVAPNGKDCLPVVGPGGIHCELVKDPLWAKPLGNTVKGNRHSLGKQNNGASNVSQKKIGGNKTPTVKKTDWKP